MRTLFFDLASHAGTVACVDGDRVARLESVDHRADDAMLMALLLATLEGAGWTMKDVERIACVTGPGGFTSLRVGVAAANALVFALGIPACGIHLSDLYAARSPHPLPLSRARERGGPEGRGEGFRWLHSTKRAQLFLRSFPDGGEAECIDVADLASRVNRGDRWTGELIQEHQNAVADLGLEALALKPLEEILPAFLSAKRYGTDTLTPWYGRGW